MKDFVYQINENECGFASLKMLLVALSKDSRYLYLPHKDKSNHMYSLLYLKEEAKKYGLLLSGYLVKNEYDLLKSKKPFILIKTLANGNKHAVLIKKTYQKFSYVYDPDSGKRIVSNKKLYQDINNGMEVLMVENYSFTNISFNPLPLIDKKNLIKIYLLETFAILSYFFSAYFIDHESHFLYPIILMVLGVLFAIAYKAATYKTMNAFDEEYIKYTFNPNQKERYENYKLMHKTKSGLLSTTTNIVLTLTSVLAINIILILNSYYSIFVIISSAVLVYIDTFILNQKVKQKNAELERIEKQFLNKNDMTLDEYQNEYTEIKDRTYKIAKLIDLKRIIMYFILLMITVFMSGVTENANIFFVLFYFAMSMFTFTSLDNCFNSFDKTKENNINLTKFYELINENSKKEEQIKI